MPNQITATGIETASQAELVTFFTTAFQTIYGSDINLDPDSPDGEMMMNFIQATLDTEDLITQTMNSMDPDLAIGVILDQRVAINGIQRQAGTFTVTPITLVITQSVTLYGLDQTAEPVYTVADNAGNQWELQTTVNITGAGTYSYNFQAANPGATLTVPNTITVPVTIVLGVQSINNPSTYTVLGTNEESDAALKIRRQQSVALASQGYLAGLYAAIENVPGVSFTKIYENVTDTTNGDGVPGHSIWVIVAGTGSAADIANAIYQKRNAGCGMYGATSYVITQIDGSPFVIYWDVVVPETLFIKFTATSLNNVNAPNIPAIIAGIVANYVPGVFEEVNINALATVVQQADSNTLVTNAGFSTAYNGSYTTTLTPTTKKNQFVITANDIIVLPMQLSPFTANVAATTTQQFTGTGGYGTYTYSISVNNSGGSINSSSGLYTAGSAGFTDTIEVTDSLSNTATATVNTI